MRTRTTALLAILAAGLTTHALIFESGSPSWGKAGRVFADLDPTSIIRIEITRQATEAGGGVIEPARTVRLEREGSPPSWWIVEPIRYEAFFAKVESMAYELADAARIAEVPPGAEAFPPGGAPIVVRFEARGGRKETVEIGEDHPDPGFPFTYCRSGSEVFVTRKEFRKLFVVTLDDLRSRALVPVAIGDTEGLEVEGEGSAAKKLEREPASGRWRLRAPLDALADRERLDEIAGDLNAWTISEFVDDNARTAEDLARYGLAQPRARIGVRRRGGETVTVEVGSPPEGTGSDLVHVRHAGQPYVALAPSKPFQALLEPPVNLRSRFVFDLGLEDVEEIRMEAPSGGVVLRRIEAGAGDDTPREHLWNVTDAAGKTFRGDQERIDSLAAVLRKLLVLKFLDSVRPEDGLDPPRFRLEVVASGGRRLPLHIGNRSEEPEDRGLPIYRVSSPGEPGAYLIRIELPDLLASSGAHAFRRRDISELEAAQLAQVDIIDGRSVWSLMRLPGETWTLSEDTPLLPGMELDPARVSAFILALHRDRLRAIRFLPELRDPGAQGLDLSSPGRGVVLGALTEGDWPAGLFRKLVLGEKPEEAGEEVLARVDLPDMPPFTVSREVSDLFDAAVEHLREVTGK